MPLRQALRHHLNPLHVFCRLRDLGLGKRIALCCVRIYERYLYFW
jgi:hypothetical protein